MNYILSIRYLGPYGNVLDGPPDMTHFMRQIIANQTVLMHGLCCRAETQSQFMGEQRGGCQADKVATRLCDLIAQARSAGGASEAKWSEE